MLTHIMTISIILFKGNSINMTISDYIKMYSNNTINTTVDRDTHKTWGIVAKELGLTKKVTFSLLVGAKAEELGKRVPKAIRKLLEENPYV